MKELNYLRKCLEESTLAKVSRDTGIHVNTLYSIKNGENENPTLKTVITLCNYFKKKE